MSFLLWCNFLIGKQRLGLGMYGEGSDSSSEDDDEHSQGHYRDSDDDLKVRIVYNYLCVIKLITY